VPTATPRPPAASPPPVPPPAGGGASGGARDRADVSAPAGSPTGAALASVGLTVAYGEGDTRVTALDEVDVAVAAGSFTAVMGPSGSGKSTLLHCLAGLERPTSGRVLLAGGDIAGLGDRELTRLRRRSVGFVFQSFNLLPALTAEENVRLPLDLAGVRPAAARVHEALDAVGLADRRTHRPAQLSGGQQQRVAVARALVTRPEVVVADEPTGNLDSRTGAEVLRLLQEAVRVHGRTVVMVTHDARAAAYADRALLLVDGRVVHDLADPTPETVLDVQVSAAGEA
jgi:putative ABC transport system ATP-binding protein